MTERLFKRLKAAHAGNAAIFLMKEEENLVVEPAGSEVAVFLGFDGHVQFVRGDDVIEEDQPLEDGAEALEWYHDQLLFRPEEYAKHLLDRNGLE